MGHYTMSMSEADIRLREKRLQDIEDAIEFLCWENGFTTKDYNLLPTKRYRPALSETRALMKQTGASAHSCMVALRIAAGDMDKAKEVLNGGW